MKKYIALVGASLLPTFAFAQVTEISDLSTLGQAISDILGIIFPILLAIAVFIIIWGIFKFILNAGDEEARKTGRSMILWGIIGIFLMLSVWGLVRILTNTIGFEDTSAITPDSGVFDTTPI